MTEHLLPISKTNVVTLINRETDYGVPPTTASTYKQIAFNACVVPKRTLISRILIAPTTVGTGTTNLDVGVGIVAPYYSEYLLADAQALTLIGVMNNAFGTPLNARVNIPSMTADTTFYLGFATVDVAKKLADVLGSTGDVFLETVTLP